MSTDLSGAAWRKSIRSQTGSSCVEMADLPSAVAVRDSKNPTGPALVFRRAEVAALFGRIRGGRLDL